MIDEERLRQVELTADKASCALLTTDHSECFGCMHDCVVERYDSLGSCAHRLQRLRCNCILLCCTARTTAATVDNATLPTALSKSSMTTHHVLHSNGLAEQIYWRQSSLENIVNLQNACVTLARPSTKC